MASRQGLLQEVATLMRDAMDKINGFPEELKSKLSHLILSHHGEIREGYGSAISPKLPEAYVLFYLDYAGSQINLVMQRYASFTRHIAAIITT